MSFTVTEGVTVYVAHGEVYEDKPDWLEDDFDDTGITMIFDDTDITMEMEGETDPIMYKLFGREYPADSIVTLGPNVVPDETIDSLMYTVIVVRGPSSDTD